MFIFDVGLDFFWIWMKNLWRQEPFFPFNQILLINFWKGEAKKVDKLSHFTLKLAEIQDFWAKKTTTKTAGPWL